MVQREFAGTESKSETESLLRKAMEDYEAKKFVAKPENTIVGMLLDMWVEEELKPGNLSNGTVMAYMGTVNRIKKYPIGDRKLKTVTAEHLQAFMDFLTFGGQTLMERQQRHSARVSEVILSSIAGSIPICGIPEETDFL